MDVTASVIIGFPVEHENFWIKKTTTDDFVSCPDGHKGGKKGKFCGDCGGKLDYQSHTKTVINGAFKDYINDDDPEGRAGEAWNPDPDAHWEDRMNSQAFEDLHLYRADPYGTSEDRQGDRTYVMGVRILHCGQIMESGWNDSKEPKGMDGNAIDTDFEHVAGIALRIGADPHSVQLYLVTDTSI